MVIGSAPTQSGSRPKEVQDEAQERDSRRGPARRRRADDRRMRRQLVAQRVERCRRKGEQVTLRVDVFGQFGYEELYKEYRRRTRTSRSSRRGTSGNLDEYTPKLTQWIAAGNGAGDVVAIDEGIIVQFRPSAGQVRQPAGLRRRRPQGQLPALEVEAGDRPPTARSTSASAPTSAAWPCATARTCSRRPACRPTATQVVRALADLGRLHRDRQEVHRPRSAPTAKFLDAATNTLNTILMQTAGNSAGYTYFDTSDKLVMERNPAVKAACDLDHGRSSTPACRPSYSRSGRRVERRLQERRVRDHRLPGVDDRRHRGPGRRRQPAASGTSPASPAAAATGAARSSPCRSRASTRRRPSSWSSS